MALTSQKIVSATQTINITKPKCSADEPMPKRMKISSSPITIARTKNGANDATFSSVADADAHDERHESVQRNQSEQHTDRSNGNGNGSSCGGGGSDNKSSDCANDMSSDAPKRGEIVDRRAPRRAGPYILGPKLNYSPIDSISMHLARHEETHEFVQLKILTLSIAANEKLTQDERQGKMLMHTEFTLLSLLQDEEGVIQQRGLFSDFVHEEDAASEGSNNRVFTGVTKKRVILVLDCLTPHDFNPKSHMYINLQQYLINRRKISEFEALRILYEVVLVIERLHKRNIIHRDIKLGNIILNTCNHKVTIINFCLGKYMLHENDLLRDQRGSPAYISPDVLSSRPYKGKPSDMWALGIVSYIMFYRQFPFYESTPAALFKKIKTAEYKIPKTFEVSKEAEQLVVGMLQPDPDKRSTATQVRGKIQAMIDAHCDVRLDRAVPEDSQMPVASLASPDYSDIPAMLTKRWEMTPPSDVNDHVVPGSESATSSTSGQRNANAATARTFGHSPLFADRRQFIEVPPQNIRSNSFQQPFGPFAVDASTNRMWQWPIPFSPPAADLFSSVLPMQQRVLRPWQCFNIASDTAAFPSFRTNASVAAAPYPLFPTLQFPANGQQSCPTRVESRPHSTRHSRRYRFRLQNEYTQRFGPI